MLKYILLRLHTHTHQDHCCESLLSFFLFYQIDKAGKLSLCCCYAGTNLDRFCKSTTGVQTCLPSPLLKKQLINTIDPFFTSFLYDLFYSLGLLSKGLGTHFFGLYLAWAGFYLLMHVNSFTILLQSLAYSCLYRFPLQF